MTMCENFEADVAIVCLHLSYLISRRTHTALSNRKSSREQYLSRALGN